MSVPAQPRRVNVEKEPFDATIESVLDVLISRKELNEGNGQRR